MEMPKIKCSNLEFRSLMDGVCDACVKSYCSCAGHAKVPFSAAEQGDQQSKQEQQQQQELWSDSSECIVHSQCSFCSRSLDDCIYVEQERSVKRKLAKICTQGDKLDRVFWEQLGPKNGISDEGHDALPQQQQQQHPSSAVGSSEELRCLRDALQLERELVSRLYLELENERVAAESATAEAMSKINRLQAEKTAILMEAREFQLIIEAKIAHDEQAIDMLNEALLLQEEKRAALEKEVQMFKSLDAADPQRFQNSHATSRSPASRSPALDTPEEDEFATPETSRRSRAASHVAAVHKGRNLLDSFHSAGQGLPRGYGRTPMDIDDDGVGTASRVHDVYEVPPTRFYGTAEAASSGHFSGNNEDDFLDNYGARWKAGDANARGSRRGYDRLGKPDAVPHSSGRQYAGAAVVRGDGDLVTELRRLNSRLQALEAEREYDDAGACYDGLKSSGLNSERQVLEEISQQLRHFQALERKQDDIKDLPVGSFVFSFKGIFSFNGLRQSLNSHINRLACMFLKHTDAGLSYGDHHVGLSHLLESGRKMNRPVPCITRGIKLDQPPGIAQQRQNVAWPMDARGRSETALGGWDY